MYSSARRGPAQPFPGGPAPTSLAAGDVNGDGIADLAVCNREVTPSSPLGSAEDSAAQRSRRYVRRGLRWAPSTAMES